VLSNQKVEVAIIIRDYFCVLIIMFKFAGSILVLLVAAGVGYLHHLGRHPTGISIRIHNEPLTSPIITLTKEQVEAYERDGAILLPNLLSPEHVSVVTKAIASAPSTFSIFDLVVWLKPHNVTFDTVRFDLWRIQETIANLALVDLPQVAAQVLPSPSFRLLRDAYFSYSPGGDGCGWHVDDEGFWPTLNDTAGVTIWIALDDMTAGGGLAVANQSRLGPDLFAKCRDAIKGNTCDMANQSPECQQRLDEAKMDWKVQAGDAILWNRWVFHRTETVNKTSEDKEENPRKRYSIRYIPSNARAHGAIHSSVEQGGTFVGSPYYPKVWPVRIESEMKALEHGLDSDITPLNLVQVLSRVLYKKAVSYFQQ
jgi:hypothetical protein